MQKCVSAEWIIYAFHSSILQKTNEKWNLHWETIHLFNIINCKFVDRIKNTLYTFTCVYDVHTFFNSHHVIINHRTIKTVMVGERNNDTPKSPWFY